MGCIVPLSPPSKWGRSNLPVTSRCGSLLLSVSADVRSADDVIAPKRPLYNDVLRLPQLLIFARGTTLGADGKWIYHTSEGTSHI